MDRGAWQAAAHRVAHGRHDWSDLAHTKASVCHSRYAQETLLRVVMHLPMASSDHVFFLYLSSVSYRLAQGAIYFILYL